MENFVFKKKMQQAPPRKLEPVDDPARQVQIDFSVIYTECDLADKRYERRPVLQMFLSNHFVRTPETGGIVNFPLDEDHVGEKVYEGSLIGTLKRDHKQFPLMSAIGLGSYAMQRNDSNHACYVNVGTNHARLGKVLNDIKQHGYYEEELPLVMRTVVITGQQPLVKGKIKLRVNRVTMGPQVKLNRESTHSALSAPLSSIENNLSDYVTRCIEMETIPDLLPGTSRVRAVMDLSQTGIESTGNAFLPVAAFGLVETPRTNEGYWQNAFEVTLARRGLKPSDYYDFSDKEKVRTLAAMLDLPVQSMDYIGDSVWIGNRRFPRMKPVRVGTEEFSAMSANAGDCEDGSCLICMLKRGFDAAHLEAPHLQELQRISKDYVPFMTLSVVHGAKVSDTTEAYGAHMYTMLVPWHQLEAGLSRTNGGREFLSMLKPSTAEIKPLGPSIIEDSKKLLENRPFAFCEGTGIIDPIGYHDVLLEKRSYIAKSFPELSVVKGEIPHEEYGESRFYLANYFAVCGDFIDFHDIPVGGFVLGTVNPKYNPADPKNAHEMLRGNLFTDMLRCSDNLAIIPQPPIPKSTMAIIREANALRPPARTWFYDPSKPKAAPERIAQFDRFVSAVRGMKRTGPPTRTAQSVDRFFLPHQFNDNLINQLISRASQATRVYDADYVIESHTNELYEIRLRLFVNN